MSWRFIMALIIIIIVYKIPDERPMNVKLPVKSEHVQEANQLFNKIRFSSNAEQVSASFDVIENAQFSDYISRLADQYSQVDQQILDYVQLIPFIREGQKIFISTKTGWRNEFSLTLIAHRQYKDHHEIIITRTSREAIVSPLTKILSPVKLFFGWTTNEVEQLNQIMTNLNEEKNKQIMQNLMMFAIGDSLEKRYGDKLAISFVQAN